MASSVNYDELYLEARFVAGEITKAEVYKDVYISHKSRSTEPYFSFQIFAVADKPNPWAALIRAPSCPSSLLTNERHTCFESWIQDCIRNHSGCQRPRFMPKRLIDLGDSSSEGLCLKEDIQQTSSYVALSHSWKFSQAQKAPTVRGNLEQRKRSIPWEDLSKTIRDAVDISRWLGIRYLWIDSFCIIQDDAADWVDQAAVMGSIYEGAYVTIAAQYDPNGSPEDGCFLSRKTFHEIVLQDPSGNPFSTFIKSSYGHDLNAPRALTSRAWCLQERLLSPRVLHFRQWEVIFECFTESRCECQTLSLEIEDFWNQRMPEKDLGGLLQSFEPNAQTAVSSDIGAEQAWKNWKDIVASYTASDLTVETDRLPALSGLAQRMPKHIFGEYLAGLWTTNLIEQLFWGHNLNDKVFRPKKYVAPSFSWASVHGGTTRWYLETSWIEDSLRTAHVVEARTILATKDPMGSVEDGFIRMRARMSKACFHLPEMEGYHMELEPYYQSNRCYECKANFDTEDDKEALTGKEVYLVEIFNYGEGAGFLLLKDSERKPDAYERVGNGNFTLSRGSKAGMPGYGDCFHGTEEREIVLV